MTEYPPGRDVVSIRQHSHELADGRDLCLSWFVFFKVADQTDANPATIVSQATAVSSMQLLSPAKRGRNLTIFHSVAVTDYEMVTDAQPWLSVTIPATSMFAMNGFDVSARGRGMMHNQKLPVTFRNVHRPAECLRRTADTDALRSGRQRRIRRRSRTSEQQTARTDCHANEHFDPGSRRTGRTLSTAHTDGAHATLPTPEQVVNFLRIDGRFVTLCSVMLVADEEIQPDFEGPW